MANDITSRYTPGGSEIATRGLPPGLLASGGIGGFDENAFFRLLAERRAAQAEKDKLDAEERRGRMAREAAAFEMAADANRKEANKAPERPRPPDPMEEQKMRERIQESQDDSNFRFSKKQQRMFFAGSAI